MEQFGIWNLLKTMLNNSPSPTSSPSQSTETPQAATEKGSQPSAPATDSPETSSPSSTAPTNACEEYLLRHERLTSGRKR